MKSYITFTKDGNDAEIKVFSRRGRVRTVVVVNKNVRGERFTVHPDLISLDNLTALFGTETYWQMKATVAALATEGDAS